MVEHSPKLLARDEKKPPSIYSFICNVTSQHPGFEGIEQSNSSEASPFGLVPRYGL